MEMWINIGISIAICAILFVEAIRDIKKRKIDSFGAVLIAIIGFGSMLLQNKFNFLSFLLSISIGIFLLVLSILSEEKVGNGDAIYLMAMGCTMEYLKMLSVSMMAFFMAAVFGIVMMVFKKASKKSKMPFIPFLFISYTVALL